LAKLFIVMGVSGTGKSTLARAIAEHYGYLYLDADDFHSEQAKAHMASGKPLTDDMRKPWIERICLCLRELAQQERTAVLAFSGLKKNHRDSLRQCGLDTRFLFLDGDAETIAQRISNRQGHFMSPRLLDSQFAGLERPDLTQETDVAPLGITPPIAGVLERALKMIDSMEEHPPG
jgi:gluconokinase